MAVDLTILIDQYYVNVKVAVLLVMWNLVLFFIITGCRSVERLYHRAAKSTQEKTSKS
jgi:hypothetical protein